MMTTWQQTRREVVMLAILAGVIAFLGMSGAVILIAPIIYDSERSYHHDR
jgi:hypothetical protein